MMIAGGILIAIGLFSTIYGIYLNNSIEAQLTALFSNGNVNPGTGWIWIGVVFLIGGVVFLVLALKGKPAAFPKKVDFSGIPKKTTHCPHCNKQINTSSAFCPYCGKKITLNIEDNPEKDHKYVDISRNNAGESSRGNGFSAPTDADL